MAVTGATDPFARLLRDPGTQRDPGWAHARASVVSAVRASTRPSWPVQADTDDLPAGAGAGAGGVAVSDGVVRAAVAADLSAQGRCVAADVRLLLQGRRLAAVEVDVVGRWDEDLRALGPTVRIAVTGTLRRVLGASAARVGEQAAVRVVDVVVGDPRTS